MLSSLSPLNTAQSSLASSQAIVVAIGLTTHKLSLHSANNGLGSCAIKSPLSALYHSDDWTIWVSKRGEAAKVDTKCNKNCTQEDYKGEAFVSYTVTDQLSESHNNAWNVVLALSVESLSNKVLSSRSRISHFLHQVNCLLVLHHLSSHKELILNHKFHNCSRNELTGIWLLPHRLTRWKKDAC